MRCRHCAAALEQPLVDLGAAPPSNAYLTADRLDQPERWYPLRVLVCTQCWLAQTEDFAQASELFDGEYAYFSGFSSSWLAHCQAYVAAMIERLGLGAGSHVVEVAANDGYLLQYVQAAGIPCTGIEPTASTAAAARALGLNIIEEFFGSALGGHLASLGRGADLMVANNVLAHVPDINDFVSGFTQLLKVDGVATFEFPHLLQLVQHNQFDTIYHEHFSYLSLTAVANIFKTNGLQVFDVETLPTHGGSLRVYAQRRDTGRRQVTTAVAQLLALEESSGMTNREWYAGFQARAERVKDDFLQYLLAAKREGRKVAAYGAAAKGNTLLNFAGIRSDLIAFVTDRNPAKQGKYLPGSRIPVRSEEHLRAFQPDDIVLLPWNLREELAAQLAYTSEWGARLVTAVPCLECVETAHAMLAESPAG
jgi:SAM-dependent methyltransferase